MVGVNEQAVVRVLCPHWIPYDIDWQCTQHDPLGTLGVHVNT